VYDRLIMLRRELASVGLRKSDLQLLLRNGFRTVGDLKGKTWILWACDYR